MTARLITELHCDVCDAFVVGDEGVSDLRRAAKRSGWETRREQGRSTWRLIDVCRACVSGLPSGLTTERITALLRQDAAFAKTEQHDEAGPVA